MDWLTEYFEFILPVALVLLFLFQRMFVRHDEEEGPMPSDLETEQEARRIQEEIRRKIIARQQGRDPESETAGAAEPVVYEEPRQQPATFPRRQERPPPIPQATTARAEPQRPPPVRRAEPATARPAAQRSSGPDIQAQLRHQRERLREARKAKEEAERRSSARGLRQSSRATRVRPRPVGNLRGQLLADLSTGDSMKRAFVLKEVVDRPIGLRDHPDIFSNWS